MAPSHKRKRTGNARSPYQNAQAQHQQQQQQQKNAGQPQFQTYYENHQKSSKPFSHPLFNLPIPNPTPQEAQFLNDEVDLYLVRANILRKFELGVELLDNVVLKNVSINEILSPLSFPNCVIDGALFNYDKFVEACVAKAKITGTGNENANSANGNDDAVDGERFLLDKVRLNGVDDYFFGNLKVMRSMEKVISEKLASIESEKPVKDYEVNEVVNDQFKYQNDKMKELYRSLGTYNVSKKDEYEKLLEGIQSEYKEKFKKNITNH
ncbi:unnamed protein product [Ambrosiozyma monospora]|uniref:Unnamed protein product n=1 Tax=Ambrosiozyma monospora TaxID=43982 RepID=A0A9W6WHU7_AMBMO|nr:unnamed protein product [Ambrosiozyma monospora]